MRRDPRVGIRRIIHTDFSTPRCKLALKGIRISQIFYQRFEGSRSFGVCLYHTDAKETDAAYLLNRRICVRVCLGVSLEDAANRGFIHCNPAADCRLHGGGCIAVVPAHQGKGYFCAGTISAYAGLGADISANGVEQSLDREAVRCQMRDVNQAFLQGIHGGSDDVHRHLHHTGA